MKIIFSLALFCSSFAVAQSYPPQAGEPGSTAIPGDSPLFKSWAASCEVVRGRQQINGSTVSYASSGDPSNVVGPSNGQILSLGDGGSAIVTFTKGIKDGPGPDFAVFENGFISNFTGRAFLELAFVEVSSDGVNFFRFPSHNEYPSDFIATSQEPGGSGFATMDARYLNNLAGKYIAGFGTPFDLTDIPDNPLLDKTKITHVKIIDVVGTNIEGFRTFDSFGNIAIDPFPTPFPSSGFDLEAVGVINEADQLAVNDVNAAENVKIYPNPASDFITIHSPEKVTDVAIYTMAGEKLKKSLIQDKIEVHTLAPGNYILEVTTVKGTIRRSFLKK